MILSILHHPIDEVHDFHLSVTHLTVEQNNTIELSIKVFYDDLLRAFGLEIGDELPKDYTSADELIQKFVKENLSISINNTSIQPIYKESISSSPAIWIYYDIAMISEDIHSIEIENNILINHFDDQVNVVNIDIDNSKKSVALDGQKTSTTFSF